MPKKPVPSVMKILWPRSSSHKSHSVRENEVEVFAGKRRAGRHFRKSEFRGRGSEAKLCPSTATKKFRYVFGRARHSVRAAYESIPRTARTE